MPSAAPVLLEGPVVPEGRPARQFARLPLWRNAWRLALMWFVGLVLFLAYTAPLVLAADTGTEPRPATQLMLAVDVLVGHVVLVLAAFRRRAPVAVAALTMALSCVSVFGAPAAFLATLSLATQRRLAPLVWLGLLNLAAGAVNELFVLPVTLPPGFDRQITGQGWMWDVLAYTVFVTLIYGVVVLIGWNIGSRRELVASWRRQADTANREQAARVAQAQLAERARIAREMHDVLAHRLSLVAMHAGVLAHRPDLSEQERVEAAEVVRSGTHQALEELREVLGVLRDDDEPEGRVEAPQPGLSGIPSLVAEVTSSGQEVRLVVDEQLWPRSVSLPASTGRHAYRVVQEALTNARRHAPGRVVTVHLGGGPGEGLTVVVSNPVAPVADGTLPSGGRGLAGMAERVQLAGGRFEARVEVTDFVVRAWMPWPGRGGEDAEGRPRVVIVDDDPLVRAGLRMMLGGPDGVDVVAEGDDGDRAVELAGLHRPDVVLMDIRMTRVDGIAATRAVLQAYPATKVLVLTTFDADDYVVEALRAGARGFVLKDTPPHRLVAAVHEVARGDHALSPSVTALLVNQVSAGAGAAGADDRAARARERLAVLTDRELEVARAVAGGGSNAAVSRQLYLGVPTVKAHVSSILAKLGLSNRVQVALLVHDAGEGPHA